MGQEELRDYFGDFRWWTRPNCVSTPPVPVRPEFHAAIAELQDVYDEATCRKLVDAGEARRVLPLFLDGFFRHEIDDLHQLGFDLLLYPGWRGRPTLVGELHSVKGFDGARFEVGVQAGLRRAGLAPRVEPCGKGRPGPDFLVEVDGIEVAIEVKRLADPVIMSNLDCLFNVLAKRMIRQHAASWRGDVVLELSAEATAQLRTRPTRFLDEFLPMAEDELTRAVGALSLNTRLDVPGVGTLVSLYPPWNADEHYVGSYRIAPSNVDIRHPLDRVFPVAEDCGEQLAAVVAGLRIAVLWGSSSELPASTTANAVQEGIADAYEKRWANSPIDWIVFLNAPSLGMNHQWSTNIGLCRLPHACGEIPPLILQGITSWGR